MSDLNIMQELDKVTFDEHAHASVNYAKARSVIDAVFNGGTADKSRKVRRRAKMTVIDFFGGKLDHAEKHGKKHTYVVFPDNSKALF